MATTLSAGGSARRPLRALAFVALLCVLLTFQLWAVAALYFDVRVPWLRTPVAVAYLAATLAVWFLVRRRWLAVGLSASGFALVMAWWFNLNPSNDRDWQPDVAVLAYADIQPNSVTVHNIRNCEYRSETDFDVRHYDKSFDLDRLRTADLYLIYWGSPHMAHTMVSFGFDGGDYLCFSIEARKEKGEFYSAVRGFFRQFELTYVVADERDVVRLRTNVRRGEEVYLYRLNGSPAQIRTFFLNYLRRVNSLRQQPEWYSALTANCTTGIRTQRAAADRTPWDWRLLVNGHGDELLYEHGLIATNLPLADLKELCHVNVRARGADQATNFSHLIRQRIPNITP